MGRERGQPPTADKGQAAGETFHGSKVSPARSGTSLSGVTGRLAPMRAPEGGTCRVDRAAKRAL